MTKHTLIYFHATVPIEASWVVFENGHIEHSTLRGDLSQMPDAFKKNDVTVIVPAMDVLLTEAVLPKLNRQRLLQALPFALEEQLIADVDALHFAIADTRVTDTVFTAITSKQKMDEWLGLLNEQQITPMQMFSAVFAVPYQEKKWQICIEKENCIIRQDQYRGFSSEPHNLALSLEMAIKESVEKPEGINIQNTLPSNLDLNNVEIKLNEIALSEQTFLESIPTFIDREPNINLLQGDYRTKRKASESKKMWMMAGGLTLVWITLAFFSNLISFFILHHQASRLDTAINRIYKKNFPAATSIVAPRERMESKLNSLTSLSNNNYFLVLLAKVSPIILETPSIKIKSLDFRDKQFNLELTAAKFDDLDKLISSLTSQGLKAKQQNAAIAGTEVKANVFIQ